MSNGAPPPVPGSAPAKKGMSPLAWIAIGCGGLVVVLVLAVSLTGVFVFQKGKEFVEEMEANPAKTTAETIIRLNPELDLVATDDEAGTITFRNNRTGEEATLNFEDIAEGRFSMTTDEGEYSIDASDEGEGGVTFSGPEGETRFGASVDLSDVPGWVPAYPGATDTQSTMHSTTADGVSGAFTSKTSDDAQTVLDHFKQLFEDRGWKIGSESMTRTGDGAFGAVTGELADEGRSINVVIIESGGASQVTVNYNEKNQ